MTSQARVALIRQTLVLLDRVSAVVAFNPRRETEPLVVEALNLANMVADAVTEERPLTDDEYAKLPPVDTWLELFSEKSRERAARARRIRGVR